MENEVKKKNKWLLIAALISFTVTVVMIGILINRISVTVPEDPPMSAPDWFDKSTRNSELEFGKTAGIIFSAFGMVVSAVIGIILLIRYNTPEGFIRKGASSMASAITSIREAITPPKKEPEKVYCEYCGSLIDEGSSFCTACGSRIKKSSRKS